MNLARLAELSENFEVTNQTSTDISNGNANLSDIRRDMPTPPTLTRLSDSPTTTKFSPDSNFPTTSNGLSPVDRSISMSTPRPLQPEDRELSLCSYQSSYGVPSLTTSRYDGRLYNNTYPGFNNGQLDNSGNFPRFNSEVPRHYVAPSLTNESTISLPSISTDNMLLLQSNGASNLTGSPDEYTSELMPGPSASSSVGDSIPSGSGMLTPPPLITFT